jgi:polysaccharide export outer membrane protein
MMTERLSLVGLRSEEVADRISDALRRDELLVNPVVSVSVLEYRSRQVTVAGAVKKPGVLQVSGRMTLLDAISLCEGLADNAGPDILVGHAADGKDPAAYQRISAKAVMVAKDPASNLLLTGGEDIRVPEAGKVFVLGNVKKPGVVEVRDAPETSVLRVLAMSEGLAPFSSNTAYIYRAQDGHAEKKEVPVPLKKIIDRKAQDVALLPGDIFYIPDNTGRRNRTEILERTLALGGGVTSALVYAGVH